MTRHKLTYSALLFLTLILASPFFFYKLGQSSLLSFDEAWYAAIARNIRMTSDPFNLYFNSSRFADHPPAGFWFISASQAVFGDAEFGSRAAAAIIGLATLVVIFILGTLVASPAVGLASAIALFSSPWFIYRARSANLDVTITFFFILTFVLAVVSSRHRKYLWVFGLSLSLLFLTKTMAPFTIIPSLIIIFWKSGLTFRDFLPAGLFFIIPLGSWAISQLINYPGFIAKYFAIGLPKSQATTIWANTLLTKTYTHEGIGAWFRPLAGMSALTPVLILLGKFKKSSPFNYRLLLAVLVFIICFLAPFPFSSRGQIWHLIPLHPFLIIFSLSVLFIVLRSLFPHRTSLISSCVIVLSLVISAPQISRNWIQFIDIPAYISDEAILSRKAGTYPYPLFIDDRFLPVAVYYSAKVVDDQPTPDFSAYFSKEAPILLITHSWRLTSSDIPKDRYQIIATDRDKLLLLISPVTQ